MEQQQLTDAEATLGLFELAVHNLIKKFVAAGQESLIPDELLVASYVAKSYREQYPINFETGTKMLEAVESIVDRDPGSAETRKKFKHLLQETFIPVS